MWLIKRVHAQELIEKKKEISIKPDEIARLINRSSPYVRKLLKNTKPEFAIHLSNGRWIIRDCPEYRDWIRSEQKYADQVQRKNRRSGKNSGILNYQGLMVDFKRWQNKVGGVDGILNWPKPYQFNFLEDTIELARLRFYIIKNLTDSEIKNLNNYSLTISEKNYFNRY